MKYTLSSKNCKYTDEDIRLIVKHIEKIAQLIPYVNSDRDEIDLVVRKYHERGSIHISAHSIKTKFKRPYYYEGVLKMTLPRKVLAVHFVDENKDFALNKGFEKLFKELMKYRGIHFKANSKYDNHSTFRGHAEDFFLESTTNPIVIRASDQSADFNPDFEDRAVAAAGFENVTEEGEEIGQDTSFKYGRVINEQLPELKAL